MRRVPLGGLLGLAWLLSGVTLPGAVKTGKAPERYPEVALQSGSKPRYLALAISPWTNTVAYVLMDGDTSPGFQRAYVWTPDDPQFSKPAVLNPGEKNRFDSFKVVAHNPSNANEAAAIVWTLAWTVRTNGGPARTETVYDYVEGKSKTVNIPATPVTTTPVFGFALNYRHGPRVVVTGSGQAPLDVNIVGELPHLNVWSNVPTAGVAPWNALTLAMPFKPSYDTRDRQKLRLSFTPALYYQNHPCQIMSLPKDCDVTLAISPYMEPPIYSNAENAVEALTKGLTAEIPFGWYDMWYQIKWQSVLNAGGAVGLQPFARPTGSEPKGK